MKPQQGITHFVAGSAGSLRKGDYRQQAFSAVGFDRDYAFLLVEIDGSTLRFQAISRTGQTVDSGSIENPKPAATPAASPGSSPQPQP